MFYLATAPDLFGPICRNIGAAGLNSKAARVVLEKPIGHDLASARAINDAVGAVFAEEADLPDRPLSRQGDGAEPDGAALRQRAVRAAVERGPRSITSRSRSPRRIGVEGRGAYYDNAGALRDMVQNHLLQLLCLVAHGAADRSCEADAVRDEKLKVLRSLRPIARADVDRKTVRGQYRAGASEGGAVPGYAEEVGLNQSSNTETFVALKAEIGNWRWAGVPFYLRTGKRLPARASEIVIQFQQMPHSIFAAGSGPIAAQPARDPAAAGRGRAADPDEQGARAGRHAAAGDALDISASPRPFRCATRMPTSVC